MAWAINIDGEPHEITGAFTVLNGEEPIQYPPNWPDCATADERFALGVAEIVEAGPPPTGVNVEGPVLEYVDGVPTRVWHTSPFTLEQAVAQATAAAVAVRDAKVAEGWTSSTPIVEFMNACQQAYNAVKAKLDAAKDADTVMGIDVSAGYPSA